MKPAGLAVLALLLTPAPHAMAAQAGVATIPFIGCIESGPTPDDVTWTAPSGKPLATDLPPSVAARLAVYASNWSAVLAPRGWVCRSIVTPLKGVAMIVAPETGSGDQLDILNGPAVIAWNDESEATVNAYAGRYFPRQLAPSAAQQTVAAAASLPPRYASDIIRYHGPLVLEYETPAHHAGLGSQASAQGARPPALPSYGLLALSSLPRGAGGIVNLTVRLPPDLAFLHGAIVKPFAACLPNRNTVACESGGAFVAQGRPLDDGD
jgi:hypothetical protein